VIFDICDFGLTSPPASISGAKEEEEMTVEAAVRTDVVFPPEDLESLGALVRFVETHTETPRLVGPTGDEVLLPSQVYQILVEVVDAMRAGNAITLAPTTQRLTTQQAANFLGVSRPTLVKLLEQGRIRFDRPGRHRRVSLLDLLAYQQSRRSERREMLRDLTSKASELGRYEKSAQDHGAALKEARRRRSGRDRT
jgi:excisionase family DNA binding protein